MSYKPNYRVDRLERTRSKALKKKEKQEAKDARRASGDVPSADLDATAAESNEDDNGPECAIEKENQ